MSSSNTAVGDSAGKVPGQRSAFLQTCSLLSQYVKDKRGAVDLSLGMACNIDGKGPDHESFRRAATMNLFPVKDKPKEESALTMFPQHSMFPTSTPTCPLKPNSSSDGKSSQMTIFYKGQVIVFDDFPAEKAKEIMDMASCQKAPNPIPVANPVVSKESSSNPIPSATCPGNNIIPDQHIQLPTARTLADLPIARKASLHRFLEKRKDRITANAPYTKGNPDETSSSSVAAGASKGKDGFPWLGLNGAAVAAGVGERNMIQSQSQL